MLADAANEDDGDDGDGVVVVALELLDDLSPVAAACGVLLFMPLADVGGVAEAALAGSFLAVDGCND